MNKRWAAYIPMPSPVVVVLGVQLRGTSWWMKVKATVLRANRWKEVVARSPADANTPSASATRFFLPPFSGSIFQAKL